MATLLESHSECGFSNRLCLHKEHDDEFVFYLFLTKVMLPFLSY